MTAREAALEAFWAWIDDYVTKPHPEIGRAGVVCPFVPGIVRAGGLRVEVALDIDGTDARAMRDRVRAAIPEFLAMEQPEHRKSFVLLFPNVGPEHYATVDRVQAALKPEAVRQGLMVGQFHPGSDEPAARNPAFPANRSPVPALAIRHMASHDILFLGRVNTEAFDQYQVRFGDKHARGRVPDRYLRARYQSALDRFGSTDGGDASP